MLGSHLSFTINYYTCNKMFSLTFRFCTASSTEQKSEILYFLDVWQTEYRLSVSNCIQSVLSVSDFADVKVSSRNVFHCRSTVRLVHWCSSISTHTDGMKKQFCQFRFHFIDRFLYLKKFVQICYNMCLCSCQDLCSHNHLKGFFFPLSPLTFWGFVSHYPL